MSDTLELVDRHPLSLRHAILHDDGVSAWMYLTEAESSRPQGDVWVYNRVVAPTRDELERYRGGPPPAVKDYAGIDAWCSDPSQFRWNWAWAADGHSVAMLRNGEPWALIVAGQPRGYCRALVLDGPWGRRWIDEAYDAAIGRE